MILLLRRSELKKPYGIVSNPFIARGDVTLWYIMGHITIIVVDSFAVHKAQAFS